MSEAAQTIADGKVVTFNFTLTDDAGNEIDSTADGVPLVYLHGAENIVPGLERQLLGKKAGDKVKAVVSPAEGYGERSGAAPQAVPLSTFPDDFEVEAGMPFIAEDAQGEEMTFWVVEVTETDAMIDADHPLAGLNLNFDVEVVKVRDATEEEQAHGHPHGADGDEGH